MLQPKKPTTGLSDSDQQILVSELTKYAQEGANDAELKEFREVFISQKKKAIPNSSSSESASTSKKTSSASSGEKTSSVTSGNNPLEYKSQFSIPVARDEKLNAEIDSKYPVGSMAWTQEKLKANIPNYQSKYNEYKAVKEVPEEVQSKIAQDVEDEVAGKGFMNTLVAGTKKFWNNLIDEPGLQVDTDPLAKEKKEIQKEIAEKSIALKKEGKVAPKVSDEEITQLAKNKKIEEKIKAQSDTQIRSFLKSTQDEGEKDNFTKFASMELASMGQKDKLNLQKQDLLRDEVNHSISTVSELTKQINQITKSGGNIPDELRQSYELELAKYQDLSQEAIKSAEEYADNRKDIGDLKDNLDVFKRDYSSLGNIIGSAEASVNSIASGLASIPDYAMKVKSLVMPLSNFDKAVQVMSRGVASDIQADADKALSEISKPISVDNINSAGDFGTWLSQTMGSQIPIYAMVATGAGGIGAIGASSTGQKYNEMINESGIDYTDAQLAGIPALFGITETASAAVDGLVLKNASRVFNSATKAERQLISDGFWKETAKRAGDLGKNMVIEGLDEGGTQFSQNVIDKYFGEKKDLNLLDGVKDAAVAGAVMSGFISGIPNGIAIVSEAIKPFSADGKVQKGSDAIVSLEKQLANPETTPESKKIIEKQLNETKSKVELLVKKTIKDVESMPSKQFNEIVNTEKKQAELKLEAGEIKSDESISPENKKQLLANLKVEFQKTEERRVDLLERGATARLAKIGLEEDELSELRNKASNQLRKEANPDGTKSEIKIDPKEVDKRALQNYNIEQAKLEAKENEENPEISKEPKLEERPQAEVQEEVVEVNPETKKKEGRYEYQGEIYNYDGNSLTNESTDDMIPLGFEEDSVFYKVLKDGKLIPETEVNENKGQSAESVIADGDIRPESEIETPQGESDNLQPAADSGTDTEVVSEEIITPKTTKSDRIAIADAKIDDVADWLKSVLPSANINKDDYKVQGFSQDQLIDLIATGAKNIAKTGIEIDEAIKQMVEALKQKFDFDVDVEAVKVKIESPEPFKRQPGKKSLLNRVYKGGNPKEIIAAVEKYGLNYEVENQELAKERAKSFIEEVGPETALQTVRDNKIKGAEKAFVYAEIIDGLLEEIEQESDIDVREQLISVQNELLAEITAEFDQESRDAGRFISALQNVYNSSKLKYNLSSQINRHKSSNGGEISEEVLAKFKEADSKIKELEEKIAEAEKRAKEAEGKQMISNIEESVKRKTATTKRDSNSKKAKDLASKIREAKINRPGIFMSATPATFVWDGAIETVAKTVEITGNLADGLQAGIDYIRESEWYKSLNEDKRREAVQGLRDYLKETTKEPFVKIDENGKISVPESMIRDFVEKGVRDINELSQKVLDTIIEEYPDLTLRQVRDAITKYGKTVNPNQEEIATEIRKMKRVGKLISGLEDANSGKRPERSGLQRDKVSREEREMKRELRDLLRDLPMDDADLSKKWKTALETVKSRLNNQIEDLEKQIANKEKSKPEKNPVEYDQEANLLKQRRDELKTALEEIVGKPELTEEQKIQRATNSLETSIGKLQNQIADANLEYKKRPAKINSEKNEQLRQTQKQLRDQLNEMRKEAGVAEKKRLETAKIRVANKIEELKTRISNKDFAKKEVRPLMEDSELIKLNAEKLKWQEVFDKDKYLSELAERTKMQKFRDALFGLWNIPRVVMATGEMSWILIQGGNQTITRLVRSPKDMVKVFSRMFKAMGSAEKSNEYERILKSQDFYPIIVKSKLAITEADHKLDAREEQFLGDYANMIWDVVGTGIGFGIKKVQGKENRFAELWKEFNPLRILERGNTVYMNDLRVLRFKEGLDKLSLEGKNSIDNIDEYKNLAKAINTLTGRANTPGFLKTTDPKVLAAIFFSFRNWVSKVNMLNPLFYLSLNSGDWKKPSVAQKVAITDFMSFVTITASMMFLLKAAAGDDEDGNPEITIETDPRSADFGKMKMGEVRIDAFGGLLSTIVFMTRILTDQTKSTSTGEVLKGGEKFGARTRDQLAIDYGAGKFNPSAGLLYNYMKSKEDFDGNWRTRTDKYGNDVDVVNDIANLKPMYWDSVKEIKKEQPDMYGNFVLAAGLLGINAQVYGSNNSSSSSSKETKSDYKFKPRPN